MRLRAEREARSKIEAKDNAQRNPRNFQLVSQEKLARLIPVTNRQKTFAKKTNSARGQQAQHECSHRHFQSARRNDKYFERGWRGQQRRHQNAEEAVPLDPGVNLLRARPGVLCETSLPRPSAQGSKAAGSLPTEPSVAIAA